MKQFKKMMVLCMAMLLVLSLVACGGKKKTESKKDKTPEQIISASTCALQVLSDVDLTIGFDENGKATAVAGDLEQGDKVATLCGDITGMSGVDAVVHVVKTMKENDAMHNQSYVILRQDHHSVVPNEKFLPDILAGVEEFLEDTTVIMISAVDMDADGYFTAEVAEKIMLAYAGADAEIVASSVLIDGCYQISCRVGEDVTDYSVSGYSGAIAPMADLITEPMEEEDYIPESEQFDIVVDESERLEDSAVEEEPAA